MSGRNPDIPPTEQLYLTGFVEERAPDAPLSARGTILASLGPVAYVYRGDGLTFSNRTPYGENRVVLLEFRRFPETTALVTHAAISEPFDNKKGQDIEVPLLVKARPSPSVPTEGAGLWVDTYANAGYVNTASISVVVVTDSRANEVVLSPTPTFSPDKSNIFPLTQTATVPFALSSLLRNDPAHPTAADPADDRNG